MTEENYQSNLKKYSQTISIAGQISRFAAGRRTDDRKVWACVLYTKLVVTGFSILILCPESDIAEKEIPHWDYSSIFSLSRNLMECYETFFYLCIDEIDGDEYKARRALFSFHDFTTRKALASLGGSNPPSAGAEEGLILELSNNEYFKKLAEKQQKHFLRGENAFFIHREEIEIKTGTEKETFKLIYKLFSSNTHTFPLGFYGMLHGERGRGIKSDVEIGYHCLALEIDEQYVKSAAKNMLELFPDIASKLNDEDTKHLND